MSYNYNKSRAKSRLYLSLPISMILFFFVLFFFFILFHSMHTKASKHWFRSYHGQISSLIACLKPRLFAILKSWLNYFAVDYFWKVTTFKSMVSFVAVMRKPRIDMCFSRCTDKNSRKYFVSEIRSLLPCEVFFLSRLSNFKQIWKFYQRINQCYFAWPFLRCLGRKLQPSLRQFS